MSPKGAWNDGTCFGASWIYTHTYSTLFVDSKAGQRLASKMLVHIARFMEATEHTLEATASTIG